VQRLLLGQVDERVDHLEPQAGVAGDGDGGPAGEPGGQQSGDAGPPRVDGIRGAPERVDEGPERAGPFQLLPGAGDHLVATGPHPGQRLAQQAGLAHARLAVDDDRRHPAGCRVLDGPDQHVCLGVTTAVAGVGLEPGHPTSLARAGPPARR
jgi:hypothetical protein